MEFVILHLWDLAVLVVGLTLTLWLSRKYNKTRYVAFISAIPGIWTSLGILGTFGSIYVSLAGLKSDSFQDIMALVTKVAPAFSTSIIGIVGAIFFSIRNKVIRASEDVREERQAFNALLNIEKQAIAMGVGAKEMAREMGREMVAAAGEEWRKSLREHVAAMRGVLEDEQRIFNRISNEIVDNMQRIANGHNQSMKKMLEGYEKEAAGVSNHCKEALRNLVEEHNKQIVAITSAHTDHLADFDREVRLAVEEAYTVLADSIKGTSDSLEEISNKLSKVGEALAEAGESAKDAGASFALTKSDIETVRKEALAIMSKNKEHMEASEKKVQELLGTAQNMTKEINDLVSSASQTVAKAVCMMEQVSLINNATQSRRGAQERNDPNSSRVWNWLSPKK